MIGWTWTPPTEYSGSDDSVHQPSWIVATLLNRDHSVESGRHRAVREPTSGWLLGRDGAGHGCVPIADGVVRHSHASHHRRNGASGEADPAQVARVERREAPFRSSAVPDDASLCGRTAQNDRRGEAETIRLVYGLLQRHRRLHGNIGVQRTDGDRSDAERFLQV